MKKFISFVLVAIMLFAFMTVPQAGLATSSEIANNLYGQWVYFAQIDEEIHENTEYLAYILSFSRPNNVHLVKSWSIGDGRGSYWYGENAGEGTGKFTVGNDNSITIELSFKVYTDWDEYTSNDLNGTYSFSFDKDKLILTKRSGDNLFHHDTGTREEFINAEVAAVENVELPSEWAEAEIIRARRLGLIPPSIGRSYRQNITRAEFCALAVTLYEGIEGEITGRTSFADTQDINVQKAAYIGVVTGVGNNMFAPDDRLTREQAATMLARLADAVGHPLPIRTPTFADNHNISSWANTAVGQAQAAGIMGGTGNNMYSPRGPYTREQSIVTILRLYDFVS